MAALNQAIQQFVNSIYLGKNAWDFVQEKYHISSFMQLKQQKENIKYCLSQLPITQQNKKHIYHAFKILFAFGSSNFTLNACNSALKAAIKLKNKSEELFQSIISEIKSILSNCHEMEEAWQFSELLLCILPQIEGFYRKTLEASIKNCLNLICASEDIDILKRSLQFLSTVKTDRKAELNNLIISASFSSFNWIEEKIKNLQGVTNAEVLERYLNTSKELIELIGRMPIDNASLSQRLKSAKQMVSKKSSNIAIAHKINNEMNESIQAILLDNEKLPIEKIKKLENIYKTYYVRESIIFEVWKGVYNKTYPICIKSYYHKFNSLSEPFKNDLKLTKSLSSKRSNVSLMYIGWYYNRSERYEGEAPFNYSIITEGFENTLIDDIIIHHANNQKYTYKEFSFVVKNLLEAFSLSESKNILHLNIKPQNILITQNKELKIVGFNISKTYSTKDDFSYSNNKTWNDLYIAPEINEQCRKSDRGQRIDISSAEKADVYSLGLIFMQMYSLLPIEELNNPEYYEEIDDYVSTFKPKHVANLLKGMLAINSSQRPSFSENLSRFIDEEETKEIDIQAKSSNILDNPTSIENNLQGLERADIRALKITEGQGYPPENLRDGVTLDFKKGLYNGKDVLIRVFKHQNESSLLPYIEEAKYLQLLTGKYSTFIDFYGYIYDNSQPYSLFLITEWCFPSLMQEITNRRWQKNYYSEYDLNFYIRLLLGGFKTLKQLNIDHRNIKPHNLLYDAKNNLKITGFVVPNTGIFSNCKFPEDESNFIQNKGGYQSPEMKKWNGSSPIDIEKSDVYSLGLVFWQMTTLCPTSVFSHEGLRSIKIPKIVDILGQMLVFEANQRKNFGELLDSQTPGINPRSFN